MGSIIVCSGNLVPAVQGRDTIDNVLACDSGWIIKPEPATDFQGLVDLLQFDPEICALLIGTCVLFFIIGHAVGHVARTLGRT
jgi:hypothetical protein